MSLYSKTSSFQEVEDHFYYNATLYNMANNNNTINASFSESRQTPIIMNPSLYNLAVARFNIPTGSIPIFNFQVGAYWVTLIDTASGDTYPTLVTHTPTSSFTGSTLVYSIQNFLNDINIALATSYAALNAAHPGEVAAAPFMTLNSATSLYTLNTTVDYATGYPNNAVQIWFSYQLFSRFEEFSVYFNSYNSPNHLDVRMIVQDTGNNVYTYTNAADVTTRYIGIAQQTAANAMSDIQTILFSTTTIPVQSEQFAVQSGSMNSNTQGQSVGVNILTDFITDISTFVSPSSAEQFIYTPTLYRLEALIGSTPLTTFTLDAYWVSRDGTKYLITIDPGRSFSIKLAFIKKGLPA